MNVIHENKVRLIYNQKVEDFLRRLSAPTVTKMKIRKFIHDFCDEYGLMLFDFCAMLDILALVDAGLAGTGPSATRIGKITAAKQKICNELAERTDECAPQAAYNRLYGMGVDYNIRECSWIRKQYYRTDVKEDNHD